MNIGPEHIESYINELIMFIEITIQKLEFEHQKHPMKLMGITPSPEFMTSMYTAIASFVFAISQFAYQRFG